jgi:hypothetical protein
MIIFNRLALLAVICTGLTPIHAGQSSIIERATKQAQMAVAYATKTVGKGRIYAEQKLHQAYEKVKANQGKSAAIGVVALLVIALAAKKHICPSNASKAALANTRRATTVAGNTSRVNLNESVEKLATLPALLAGLPAKLAARVSAFLSNLSVEELEALRNTVKEMQLQDGN